MFRFTEKPSSGSHSQYFVANRRRPLTAFLIKILDSVSSIGSGAGIAASSRRGSTSKGAKVSNLLNKFFLTIPVVFGSPHDNDNFGSLHSSILSACEM